MQVRNVLAVLFVAASAFIPTVTAQQGSDQERDEKNLCIVDICSKSLGVPIIKTTVFKREWGVNFYSHSETKIFALQFDNDCQYDKTSALIPPNWTVYSERFE